MARFRGTGKKYKKEILKGATSAAVGGGIVGAAFPRKGQTRAYSAGQGAGIATSSYLLSYGARTGYKSYKKKKQSKGGVTRGR